MSEHKSHRVKIANLAATKPVLRCQTKSYLAPALLSVVAGYILVIGPHRYYAVPVAFIALMLVLVPNHVLLEGFEKYLIIFKPQEKEFCTLVYLSEISRWDISYDNQNQRCLFLMLNDGELIAVPNVICRPLLNYLANNMADKKGRIESPKISRAHNMRDLL